MNLALHPRSAVLSAAATLCVIALLGASRSDSTSVPAARAVTTPDAADSVLWIDIRNVNLRVGGEASMQVKALRGRVLQTTPGNIAWLDDVNSFSVAVTSGSVALDGPAMTALMNKVFDYRGAPIKKLQIRFENGQVVQKGVMHKGVDLNFEMWGNLTLTPDGLALIHPTKLRLMGVDGLKLLHALGLKMSKVLDTKGTNGIVTVQGDDMLIDPMRILPPPHVTGKISTMRVEGDALVQTFVTSPDNSLMDSRFVVDSTVRNYVYYRGGQLKFGKLLMTPTDLLIRDVDARDAFDLDLPRYEAQLAAGYTRILRGGALRTYMPDFADLEREPIEAPLVPAPERYRPRR